MARKRSNGNKTTARNVRPELPRAEPIRSWSTLFGGGASPPGSLPSAAVNSVQRGVELGYRVVDDYIKQGAAMASSFTNPSSGQSGAPPDLSRMTERMMKYASDFTSLWFDAMGTMMAGMGAQAGAAPMPQARDASREGGESAFGATQKGEAGSRVIVKVKSGRPTEVLVTLDGTLRPGAKVHLEELRGQTGEVIKGGAIEPPSEPGGPIRVSVDIPDSTPKGRYTAVVLDGTSGNPVGRLTIILEE